MTMKMLLVAIGGSLGAIARYSITTWFQQRTPSSFPHGTLIINIFGSFLFGFLIGYEISSSLNLLIGIGFSGAFTTFSAINLELIKLYEEKHWVFFCNYIVLTFVFGIAIAYAGFMSASLLHELSTHF